MNLPSQLRVIKLVPITAVIAAIVFTLSAYAQPVVPTGLQVYYTFNDNVTDQSGNALPLTLSGAALATDRFGVANHAMGFAGNVSTASFNYSLANKSFSVGAWFYQPVFSTPLPTAAGGFAQGDVGLPGQAFRFMTDYYSLNNLIFSFWFDDYNYPITGRIRANWMHIFATFDNDTRTRKIYIDGTLVASNVAAYGFSGTGPLRFGFMPGSMDEVRVYDRALSDAEVAQIYSSERQQNPHADCEALLAELLSEVEGLSIEKASLTQQVSAQNQQIISLQSQLAQSQAQNTTLQEQQNQAATGLDEIWRLLQLPPGPRNSNASYTGPLGMKINQIIKALVSPPGKTSSNGK